jgi:flagellar biosynthesis protein FlhG
LRGLEELDYYEILELSRDASFQEIEEAYRILRETYADGSLALYSLFSEGDAVVMRERMEEAYRVLSDLTRRREYDETRRDEKELPPAFVSPAKASPAKASPAPSAAADAAHVDRELLPLASSPSQDAEIEEPDGGVWDGAALRRARIQSGLELEEIAEVTKVGIRTLRQLEDDAFDDLPATVYVRGFVMNYARTIGIDPARVAASYLRCFEESRSEQGRGRFLGRR